MARKRIKKESIKQKSKIELLNGRILTLERQLSYNSEKITELETKIAQNNTALNDYKKFKAQLTHIESSYQKNKQLQYLHFNTNYQELKRKTADLSPNKIEANYNSLTKELEQAKDRRIISQAELITLKQNLQTEQKIHKKEQELELLNKLSAKPKALPILPPLPTVAKIIIEEIQIEPEWGDISFHDGHIIIKYKQKYYRKYTKQSKKYLNEIKHYYHFHSIPKLKLIIRGSEIAKIINEEVLFYHIDFLDTAALIFNLGKIGSFKLSKWQKYTKLHYKNHLPFAFPTHTLKKLCEYCDSFLPIIPVAEAVINSSGGKTIHNSFLFPLRSHYGIYLIWESVEESKASYVFKLTDFCDDELQVLFDYIAGDTPNKRWALINSRQLQQQLSMKFRIMHKDLTQWELEIQSLIHN
jgi:hypothetical protein